MLLQISTQRSAEIRQVRIHCSCRFRNAKDSHYACHHIARNLHMYLLREKQLGGDLHSDSTICYEMS